MSQPLVIIQARTGSTRLPGKIHELIGSKRMIDHVIDRVRATGLKWALAMPQDYRSVAEEDVLGRFHALLSAIDPEEDAYDPIIRITGDCPMLDTGLVLHVLGGYMRLAPNAPHYHATGPEWDGLDVEVVSRALLARAHLVAQSPFYREHPTAWIWHCVGGSLIPSPEKSLRFSVDDQEGLEFIRKVFTECEHCAGAVPHHTNAAGSVGGADRHFIWDLHHLERGDLVECTAHKTLVTRMGGPTYVSR